ncbi:MAG: hypothetical protein HZA17_06605 [Nitrospirae bacterium]|nr:hypothetical protein [Nitrospirota bacterium]
MEFIADIKKVLDDPLPPISDVLSGYSRPDRKVPSLVVADFTSENEAKRHWGQAVGRIVRRKIMCVPKILLRMPDLHVLRDDAWRYGMPAEDVLKSRESIKLIGQRLGIENALTGNISVDDSRFSLELSLRKLPSGEIYKTFHYSGDLARMPETLSAVALQVYKALGVSLDHRSKEYLARRTPETFEDIRDFAYLLSELHKKPAVAPFEAVKKYIDRGVFLPAAAQLSLYYMAPGKDPRLYLRRLEEVAAAYPEDAGIEMTVATYMGYKNAKDLAGQKVQKFQKIIRENPNDPSAMIKFIDFLAGYGHTRAALVVSMEALERWPDHYRVWWSMAYALKEYAWQERGIKYWSDVSEKGKRLFPALKDLADKAADRALEFNQDASNLWVLKMATLSGYSPEVMECFFNAIRLNPYNREAYISGLNFSLPQWGGSYDAQEKVWELAVKNNPGADWLEATRKKYMRIPPLTYKVRRLFTSHFKSSSFLIYITLASLAAVVVAITVVIVLKKRT